MAAPKLPVPNKGLSGAEDVTVKNKGRWGFVHFFFLLSVALCVLLYAPRVLVLAPYAAIDIAFFAPANNSSSSSSPSPSIISGGPALQQQQQQHQQTSSAADDEEAARPILDNEVHSPCASMRRNTICCDRSSVHTDVCFMSGEVRTDPASLSLLLFDHHAARGANATTTSAAADREERVRPYPRKWERFIMDRVEEVRLRAARPGEEQQRRCDVRHDAPLLVMSAGGYTGNLFHAFNDGFLPAWVTAQHLGRRVVLGVLAYNPWWAGRFGEVISGLSEHRVVDLLHDKRTHCFTGGAIVGTRYHGILVVDPARLLDNRTIVDFHQMLAGAYDDSNKPSQRRRRRRPRLGIVSRKGTRVIENEAAVARLARSVGFDVEVLETANGAALSAWYAAVSGCDALLGVHGADLTTFLFLRPGRASLAQIAPLGVGPIARDCFGGPAARMRVRYEQYEVAADESSLARTGRYAPDDAVLADPEAAKRAGGWDLVARVYLGGQNVTLDLDRFRHTLARMHAHALRTMQQEQPPQRR